ncbi:MAG: DNA-directed RNA polymerase subunit alpha, partial [Minisyncoccales bacterium]
HEFSTIEGIKEDILLILLNLKQLRFKMHGDEPQVATLSVKGPKKVTGHDFVTPTQLEILNKDLEIATLTSKDAKLKMEITVEKGLGYVPREVLKKEKVEIGTIILDAVFT